MFKGYEWVTAWRYVRSKNHDGFISVVSGFALLGITLGVAALVLVMAVMGGLREELLSRLLGVTGHVTVSNGKESIIQYKPMENILQQYPSVKSAVGFVNRQALLTVGNDAQGIMVRGVDTDSLQRRKIFRNAISDTDYNRFKTSGGVLIGSGIAKSYGLDIGDEIALMVPRKRLGKVSRTPKIQYYKIAGTFSIGMYQYDSGMVIMPIRDSQSLFGVRGVTQIEVILENPDTAFDFVNLARDTIDAKYVQAWQNVNMSFFNALEIERNTMFIILTIMIIIAAFNVVTGQILIVKDRMKSIAVMRTIGVSRASIVRIFFLVGTFMGTVGTLCGVTLGVLLTTNLESLRSFVRLVTGVDIFDPSIYFLSEIPTKISVSDVVFIAVFSIIIAFIAALYPAVRAGRMNPVEGLKND